MDKYTSDTRDIISVEDQAMLDQFPLQEIDQKIQDDSDIEYFECIHCHKFNAISSTPHKRFETRVHHVKVNDRTWGSLKRFAVVYNYTMDEALTRMLYMTQSKDFSALTTPKRKARRESRGH